MGNLPGDRSGGSGGDSEVVEPRLVVILRREAGVARILMLGGPLLQIAVVEHLEVVGDDEGNDADFRYYFNGMYSLMRLLCRVL